MSASPSVQLWVARPKPQGAYAERKPQVNTRITASVREALAQEAAAHGMTISEWLRVVLEEYVQGKITLPCLGCGKPATWDLKTSTYHVTCTPKR
ncbi:MAG: hypothetical protein ACYDFT_00200 [Thermoplasmata archaeon]